MQKYPLLRVFVEVFDSFNYYAIFGSHNKSKFYQNLTEDDFNKEKREIIKSYYKKKYFGGDVLYYNTIVNNYK